MRNVLRALIGFVQAGDVLSTKDTSVSKDDRVIASAFLVEIRSTVCSSEKIESYSLRSG